MASQYTTNLSVLQGQLESAHANVDEARADAAAKMTAAQETSTAQVKQASAAAAEQVIPCYSILLTRGGIRYPSLCYAMLCCAEILQSCKRAFLQLFLRTPYVYDCIE